MLRRAQAPMTVREIAGHPDSREGTAGHPEAGRRPAGGYSCCPAEAHGDMVTGAGVVGRRGMKEAAN